MAELTVLESRIDQVRSDIAAIIARQDAVEQRVSAGEKLADTEADRITRLEIVVFGDARYNVPGIMKELAKIHGLQTDLVKAREAQAAQWAGAQMAIKVLGGLLGANMLTQLPDLIAFLSALFR